jgi:hypothetical protein
MAGAISSALAGPIPTLNVTINGNLSEWGVTLANNNGSNILPDTLAAGSQSPCVAPANSAWACEDTNDTAGTSGFVGPQHGGQDYDVEFLGAARGTGANANTLFVGIASGLRPDNGANLYGPGDLFLMVNGVSYVIEMGGGLGHTGGPDLGVQIQGAPGSHYNLNGSGYTLSETSLAAQTVGSIWTVAGGTTTQTGWAGGPTQFLKGASQVSLGTTATVYSTRDSLSTSGPSGQNQHAVIELGIDLTQFGSGPMTIDELRWGPACFNDVLSISGTVPEPSTPLLLGLGWVAFAGLRRRARESR